MPWSFGMPRALWSRFRMAGSLRWRASRAVSGLRSTDLVEDIQDDPVKLLALFLGAQGAQGTEVVPRCDGPLGFCRADQSGLLPDSVGVRRIAFKQDEQFFHGLCARVRKAVASCKELSAQFPVLRFLFRAESEFVFDEPRNLIAPLVAGTAWLGWT